jgi:hypothetical protein
MRFCVQREEAAHLRDRLALRLLRTQYTAATADQLVVILPQFAKAVSTPAFIGWRCGFTRVNATR